MKSLQAFISGHQCFVVYSLLMLGSGVWQLLDWRYGSEDPIWHLFFYLLFMPAFSFGFGIFAGNSPKFWLIPFTAGFLSAFVYVFMGNGGFSMDAVSVSGLKSALELCFPCFASALTGVVIRRIAMLFEARPPANSDGISEDGRKLP